jgi:hypothetical protein
MTVNEQWEKFLLPEVTRDRLIASSMFITTFELLKESIVGRLRDYYLIGFDKSGDTFSSDYQNKVLDRNKSPLYASIDWLVEMDALDKADEEKFDALKAIRNKLAHELPSIVLGEAELDLVNHFQEAFTLLRKIEIWWVVNVEIPTNPDYDGHEVDEKDIEPGPVLMLKLMLDVVNGNTEYLDKFRKMNPSTS